MPRLVALAVLLAAGTAGCISVYVPAAAPPEAASPAAAPSLGAGEVVDVLHLDTRSPRPVEGDVVLERGRDYLVTVSGTYSVWAPRFWRQTCYGQPEPRAMYPSPEADGPVGIDAAYRFATPAHSCPEPDLVQRPGWLYRLRRSDPWAPAPVLAPYNPDHEYRYRLRGEGEPLQVRTLHDPVYTDNYGRLRVVVQAVVP